MDERQTGDCRVCHDIFCMIIIAIFLKKILKNLSSINRNNSPDILSVFRDCSLGTMASELEMIWDDFSDGACVVYTTVKKKKTRYSDCSLI